MPLQSRYELAPSKSKVDAVYVVRVITGRFLKEAKELVESAPTPITTLITVFGGFFGPYFEAKVTW